MKVMKVMKDEAGMRALRTGRNQRQITTKPLWETISSAPAGLPGHPLRGASPRNLITSFPRYSIIAILT